MDGIWNFPKNTSIETQRISIDLWPWLKSPPNLFHLKVMYKPYMCDLLSYLAQMASQSEVLSPS